MVTKSDWVTPKLVSNSFCKNLQQLSDGIQEEIGPAAIAATRNQVIYEEEKK